MVTKLGFVTRNPFLQKVKHQFEKINMTFESFKVRRKVNFQNAYNV